MRFVDVVEITVIAGNGGDGRVSFLRRGRNRCLGKPDGSDGGDGGDVLLLVDTSLNTLNYFHFNRIFKASHGSRGSSKNCTGKRGKNLVIKVPQGTRVRCQNTYKLLGDMVGGSGDYNNVLIVAKGGRHGLGNQHSKYYLEQGNSQNKFILQRKSRVYGMSGEIRHLLLELILIADVGLFGLPNSGKSSFLSVVSRANPKIANYPFTTLTPNLGTVQIDNYNNKFIIADIPGIIKGASTGLGLGIQFLKHLERCSMLLHFVDINPEDNSDPIENILIVEQELLNYSVELTFKTRWLVFNKIDLLDNFTLKNKINNIIKSISWKNQYYAISVIDNRNILSLCNDIMKFIKNNKATNSIKNHKNNKICEN